MNLALIRPWLTSVPLVLFAYSGLFKWIPSPVDPTLLSGVWLLIWVLFAFGTGVSLKTYSIYALILVSAFFGWYALTTVYSASDSFWLRKSLGLTLNLMAFSFPVICMRTAREFSYYLGALLVLGLGALAVVFFFDATDLKYLMYQGYDKEESRIPDYLTLGSTIGVAAIVIMGEATLTRLTLGMICFSGLAILGGRGPALFAPMMVITGYYLRTHGKPWRLLRVAAMVATLAVAWLIVSQWWDTQFPLYQRMSSIMSGHEDTAIALRFGEFQIAREVITDSPFLGTGLGGYGKIAYQSDTNVYPHNLFLEAQAEAGVIGLFLFCMSLWIVFIASRRCWNTQQGIILFSVLGFAFLNHMKSGGFISARALYMHMGVMVAFAAFLEDRVTPQGLSQFHPSVPDGFFDPNVHGDPAASDTTPVPRSKLDSPMPRRPAEPHGNP